MERSVIPGYVRAAGVVLVLAALAGCAASPEADERRRAAEADIDDILSLSVDADGESLAQNCLRETSYRSYRVLGDRYLVFDGRRDEIWINKLASRCPDLDLRPGSIVAVRSFSSTRICENDTFVVSDWFDFPSATGTGLGSGIRCRLGPFVPVSADQLAEIKAALERR